MSATRCLLATSFALALLLTPLVSASPASAQAPHVPCPTLTAQSSAQFMVSGPYIGYYKYTITMTWDVGVHDPSHVDILVGLADCACVCDPRLFAFASPAGTSTGLNASGPCVVPFAGMYLCKGDPSIKDMTTGPAVKFVPDETACSTDETGSGTFVFYSPLPPGPNDVLPDAVAIKHGTDVCYGAIVGVLPMCDCSVPASATTWGKLKSYYH